MLYVSAVLSGSRIAITDTDDGVTEYIPKDELYKYLGLGIQIKGAEFSNNRLQRLTAVSMESSKGAAKLSMLRGIDIQVANGVLVCLRLFYPLKSDFSIRLSDYCSRLENNSIQHDFLFPSDYTLTLILDDKINFNKLAFNAIYMRCKIKYDITELKDDKLAERVYKAVFFSLSSDRNILEAFKDKIIDNKSRLLTYYAYSLVERNSEVPSLLSNDELDFVHKVVVRKYKRTFMKFSGIDFEIVLSDSAKGDVGTTNYFTKCINSICNSSLGDTDMKVHDFAYFLCCFTTLVKRDVHRFMEYITYFPDDLKDKEIVDCWFTFIQDAYKRAMVLIKRDYKNLLSRVKSN